MNNEEFYIGHLQEETFQEALKLIEECLLPDENFCKALQIHKKPNAVKELAEFYMDLFPRKTSLACYKKTIPVELVGLNVLAVEVKGVKNYKKVRTEY